MKSIGESLGFTTQEECDKYNQMVTDIIMSDDDKIEQKPTDEDMKEALRTEYEKGRADAIAEMQKPWSEEDERTYKSIIYSFAHNYPLTIQQQEFVKSLKSRNTWKPSKGQIDAISVVVRNMKNSDCYDSELVSLYQDLLKLKD